MICSYCGKELNKTTSEINRAKKAGLKLYCSRECSGFGRRSKKTNEQKKIEKKLYDKEYRNKNKDLIRLKKREYFKKDYSLNPEKYKQKRKDRYGKHLEYLSKPKYKSYKKEYDKKYTAKKNYGDFWESSILLNKIENQIPNNEVKQQLGLINKSQKRKRNYEKIKCEKFERCSLGNIERS